MASFNPAKCALPVCLAVGLSGCITPEDYESPPVEVTTDKGIVTCQLYTLRRVLWDRSIDRPATMSTADADAICLSEGKRYAAEVR